MQRLNGLIEGESSYDPLLRLMEKGLVCADSFLPVRQWMNKEKLEKATVKQRVYARAKATSTGRWELTRPCTKLTIEQEIERAFDRSIILCRETASGLSWGTALETLRVWEYTGRVRRGYFIEGLSGVQFIREKEFASVIEELQEPREEIVWMSAVDPAQPWGKSLTHLPDKAFLAISGTAVALYAGLPVAVFERQGKVLRILEHEYISEALRVFAQDYSRRRIYPTLNRMMIKQYPKETVEALTMNGFIRELQDYTLYRN